MSLDFYLHAPKTIQCPHCLNEVDLPGEDGEREVFDRNITHNLGRMFDACAVNGTTLYQILWRGDGKKASEVLPTLVAGLADMRANEAKYAAFNPENGWGSYESALSFLVAVIDACTRHPTAIIHCSR